ncbi:MAG: helix-turn-helix transcriptional regulator [Hydrogenophaga sp.]|nr:helix-turn-helix transcriptional regulator [Hydrogenophaga sp.]
MNERDFFEARAKSIIKDLREEKGLSYKELARRLESQGMRIDVQVLINRVNQGKFSFAFALRLLAAMGAEHVDVPRMQSLTGQTGEKHP